MDDKPDTTPLDSSDEFETAYTSHAPGIYRFLFWRTNNTALSQDLTSGVFEKAWRARKTFHGTSPKSWLYTIARNLLTDHWRKKQDILLEDPDALPQESSAPSIENRLDTEADIQRLRQAVETLPDTMRSVIQLRFIKGYSSKQTARQLHTTEGNIRILQYRALQKLRRQLQ
jgi:RNA polymerase sigma-70 factor (ECF subfamily)